MWFLKTESFIDSFIKGRDVIDEDFSFNIQKNYCMKDFEDRREIYIPIVGHDPKQVKLEVKKDILSINSKLTSDLPYSSILMKEFFYTFSTINFDAEGVKAKSENGILIITLPLLKEKKSRTIEIS